jgi:argininosuccinate lyase
LACASAVNTIIKGLPGGYQRDLQETKEPFMEGLAMTRSALRAVALVMAKVTVDREALDAGFSPGVFATDRALELVSNGVPFRDAYRDVKENLDALTSVDPKKALSAKVHEGAPAGLDFKLLNDRVANELRFVKGARNVYDSKVSKLLGVDYPIM